MPEAGQVVHVEVPGKPWWKSKTIWVNVLGGAAEMVNILAGVGFLPAGVISVAVNGITIVLRRISTQPITPSGQPHKLLAVARNPNKPCDL